MKNFKRIMATFLAVIMTVMTFSSTTAFAAEVPIQDNVQSEVEISQVNTSTSRQFLGDDHFSFVNSAAGTPFTCKSNTAFINIWIKPNDGSTIVAVRLHDITNGGNVVVKEWQSSNGLIYDPTFSVTKGHTYIFEYLCAYGNPNITIDNFSYEEY